MQNHRQVLVVPALAGWVAVLFSALALIVPVSVPAQPSGEVMFSGPGAGTLPGTTYTPVSCEIQPAFVTFYTFFDAAGTRIDVGYRADLSAVTTVQVIASSLGWTITDVFGLSDVSLAGDTITMSGITVPAINPPGAQEIILNGTLTCPDTAPVEGATWGWLKTLYQGL